MARLDLRALCAPIESLRDDVAAAYVAIDRQWEEVAAVLRELPIPVDVSYMFDDDVHGGLSQSHCLEWRKINGSRRIAITSYREFPGSTDDEHVQPYEEWSAESRIAMLEHVPQLFEAAFKATKRFIGRANGQGGEA